MALTMKQISMLNHAAYIQKERSDRRYAKSKGQSSATPSSYPDKNAADQIVFNGKPLNKLTTEEYLAYLNE